VLLRRAIQHDGLAKNLEALKVFQSICALPTLFEDSSGDVDNYSSDLIRQAVRQNVQGTYISPVSSLQWVHLTLLTHFGVTEPRLN